MVRARDAVDRSIRENSGIAAEELLKRMDDRIDATLLRLRCPELGPEGGPNLNNSTG